MRELAATALRWLAEDRAALLVRPITEQGFGPKHPHDALLLDRRGPGEGSLYAGAFDEQLRDEAVRLPDDGTSRVCRVEIHGRGAADAGLTCGGSADVLLQPLASVPREWWTLLSRGEGAALVTGLDADATHSTSTVVGGPADGARDEAVGRAEELLSRHRAGREVRHTDSGLTVIEVSPPLPHLLVVGGGDLSALLVAQARTLGWMATTTQDTGLALRVIAAHPAAVCLAMLSHDPDVDTPVLAAALRAGLPYVGALGSRRTQAARAARLAEAGVPDALVASVHGPLGLDLGARTPAETALAVCAEVLAALGARSGRGLRETSGPINA